MKLSIRPKVYSLPSYSLTGDLLGFLRCGLQYRYTRIGRLPPSRPVQLWFGEFIHGVLEEGFRRYRESVAKEKQSLPPWSDAELDEIRELIEKRLSARGLFPWDPDLEDLGNKRADVAIQELGPHLFPLIHRAEVRLYGARMLPAIPKKYEFREADRYEMVGVIDVVTHVELGDPALAANPLVQQVLQELPDQAGGSFEIIVDYKGMRRPPSVSKSKKAGLWEQYSWQLQTYGELRRRQADALPVAAGVLVYVNELYPTRGDLEELKREIRNGTTDVAPQKGSEDEKRLNDWSSGKPLPELSFKFRLARAIRVIPIDDESIKEALVQFDKVVERIEMCLGKEAHGSTIMSAWERNYLDESTCVVCDSRTYCADYQAHYAVKHGDQTPRLPAVKKKK